MLQKTRGIVIHQFRYSETSIIARIFTEDFGMQSFLVPGVKKSKSSMKSALFQPLNLVEMVAYLKPDNRLQRLKEIKTTHPLSSIPYESRKSSIALFLAEILLHSLREQEPNPYLFRFVLHSIETLDQTHHRIADFHLLFMIQLSKYLGFAPHPGYSEQTPWFNLKEGCFQSHELPHPSLNKTLSFSLHCLNETETFESAHLRIPGHCRSELLRSLINYYRFHIDGFPEIKSLEILEMVWV